MLNKKTVRVSSCHSEMHRESCLSSALSSIPSSAHAIEWNCCWLETLFFINSKPELNSAEPVGWLKTSARLSQSFISEGLLGVARRNLIPIRTKSTARNERKDGDHCGLPNFQLRALVHLIYINLSLLCSTDTSRNWSKRTFIKTTSLLSVWPRNIWASRLCSTPRTWPTTKFPTSSAYSRIYRSSTKCSVPKVSSCLARFFAAVITNFPLLKHSTRISRAWVVSGNPTLMPFYAPSQDHHKCFSSFSLAGWEKRHV